MKRLKLKWQDDISRRKVLSLLEAGKVIIGPSDTVFGFYAMPTQEGFTSLNIIKKRDEKPYLLLISCLEELKKYISSDQLLQFEKIINQCWPGPLTIIFKAREDVPTYCCSFKRTIACRMPAWDQLRELLQVTGPLLSTSANVSGQPFPVRYEDIDPLLIEKVAGVLEGKSQKEITPSTIIDVSTGTITIIREGAFDRKKLETLIG